MITNRTILCQKNIDIREGFFPKDLKPEEVLFFDIETTGLSPGNSQVFLIGAVEKRKDGSPWSLIQFLAESRTAEEEKKLLKSFAKLISGKKYLVHFNGTSFDVPYLCHRYKALGLVSPFSSLMQIDLYRELTGLPGFSEQTSFPRRKRRRKGALDAAS